MPLLLGIVSPKSLAGINSSSTFESFIFLALCGSNHSLTPSTTSLCSKLIIGNAKSSLFLYQTLSPSALHLQRLAQTRAPSFRCSHGDSGAEFGNSYVQISISARLDS